MLLCSLCSLEQECAGPEHLWSCRSHSQYQSPEQQIWWCSELLQLRAFVVLMIHNIFWSLLFIWRWPLIEQFVISVPTVSYSYNVWYCQSRLGHILLMDILGVMNYREAFSIWWFMINARITFSGVRNRMKTINPNQREWQISLSCIPYTSEISSDCREFHMDEECKTEHTVLVKYLFSLCSYGLHLLNLCKLWIAVQILFS